MNWMILAAWGPVFVAIVTAVFISGQVTGRIKDQEKTLVAHNDRLDGHDTQLQDHAIAIAKAESWREGFNAGKSQAR